MKRKIALSIMLIILMAMAGCSKKQNDGIVRTEWGHTYDGYPVVYIAKNVSADGLLSAYESLEASFDGTAAIHLSRTDTDRDFTWTGLIEALCQSLDEPVIVETPSSVDFSNFGCTIVLSHFRSHKATGFNGTVKQTAIISATSEKASRLSASPCSLESLAEGGKRTVDSLEGRVLYINVVDRTTIESAGVVLPESGAYDIGILASYDPVALDQACVDILATCAEGGPLLSHITSCNGLYTLTYGELIGLGSRTYALTILEDETHR